VEELVEELMKQVKFPDLKSVKLNTVQLPDTSPHKARCKIPAIPGEETKPYLLAVEDPNPKDTRADTLYGLSRNGHAIVFGASGCGKTWLLMNLFRKYWGIYFVPRVSGDKNYGSMDLSYVATFLEDKLKNISDHKKRHKFAEIVVSIAAYIRACVLQTWRDKVEKSPTITQRFRRKDPQEITPWQWLLVQLHPEVFFGKDVFHVIIDEVLKNATLPDHTLHASEFNCSAVDEAQDLMQKLKDDFESTQTSSIPRRRNSLRGFLSPVLSGLRAALANYVIMSGTGLSMLKVMLEPNTLVNSGVGDIKNFWDRAFYKFPLMEPAHVRKYLKTHLKLEGEESEAALKLAERWLSGRRRPAAKVVEMVLSNDVNSSFIDVLNDYVKEVTMDETKSRSYAAIVKRFETRESINHIQYLTEKNTLVEVDDVWNTFKTAAFRECHGLTSDIQVSYSPALVEISVAVRENIDVPQGASIKLAQFEALVLETMRVYFTRQNMLGLWLIAGIDNSDRGSRFEYAAPYFVPFEENGTKSLLHDDFFPALGATQRENLKAARTEKVFDCVWEVFPPAFGKVAAAVRPGSRFKSLYDWIRDWLGGLTFGMEPSIFPDTLAGPDYVRFVRCETNHALQALVLYQCKFGDNANWNETILTLDPLLLYHQNRSSNPMLPSQYEAVHRAFLRSIQDIPVIRIVLSAKHDFRAVVELNEHGRPGSRYTKDLLIVVSRDQMLNACFGDQFGNFLKSL
jgi:hypothetical protein